MVHTLGQTTQTGFTRPLDKPRYSPIQIVPWYAQTVTHITRTSAQLNVSRDLYHHEVVGLAEVET